jgi:hypothetical protein
VIGALYEAGGRAESRSRASSVLYAPLLYDCITSSQPGPVHPCGSVAVPASGASFPENDS